MFNTRMHERLARLSKSGAPLCLPYAPLARVMVAVLLARAHQLPMLSL